MIASGASAQELSDGTFNAKGYVSYLNAVSAVWSAGELTNADVALIAAVGCDAVRAVVAENLLGNAATWLEAAGYPDPDLVEQVDMTQFVAFEIEAFRSLGATEDALAVLAEELRSQEVLPLEPPSIDVELAAATGIEERYCDMSWMSNMDPGLQAREGEFLLASSVTDTVIGAATIAVDAFISVGSGGADAAVVSIVSGGVGYDLIKRGMGG
jgi:hypothetical protein